MKNSSAVLLTLLVVAAVLHAGVIAQDFSTLARNGYLYDDSFYAFQIARNIATGQGATFDGVNATNGFQPLYVAVLVPVYMVAGSDPIAPIYAALVLLALCTLATAVLLYRIVRRYAPEPAALAATALWVLCPIVIRQTANGLETALALLLFAASVDYYLGHIRPDPGASRGAYAKLGLLLGLGMLARVDIALLALAMGLDWLLLVRRRGDRAALPRFASTAGIAALVYSPWLVYSLATVGSALQESGMATRYLSIAYAPFFDLGPRSLAADGPDASFIWAHVTHSLAVLKANPVTHVMFRALEKIGVRTSMEDAVAIAANVVGLAMLGIFLVWALSGRRERRGELNFLLLFSAMLIAAYSTWIFGAFFFTRYYYPVYFVLAVYGGVLMADLFRRVAGLSRVRRRALVAGAALYLAAFSFMAWTCAFHSTATYGFFDVATWVQKNTAEDEVIGVFQGGAIGYFSGRRVINLDGKVNHEAGAALRDGRLEEYVERCGVDLIMDDHKVLELFFGPWDREEYRRVFSRAACTGADVGVPGWLGYRLPTPHGQRASAAGPAGPTSAP